MPNYRRMGVLPPKRHIQFKRDKQDSFLGEGLYYEHVVTTAGFDRAYTIAYHLRPPTRVTNVELVGEYPLEEGARDALRHHHLQTQKLSRIGNPITGRVPLLFNDDLVSYRCKPVADQDEIYRNGSADEVIFINNGGGFLETHFGRVPYRRGDYVVVPQATNYRLVSDDVELEDHLILECFGPVRIPALSKSGRTDVSGCSLLRTGFSQSERNDHDRR